MKAVILAGGRGERLKPLTDKIPKPMIEVSGKPILYYIIHHLKKYGIKNLIIALCYLSGAITKYFGNGEKFGVRIKYTYENPNSPLGTAGAIKSAKNMINGAFIVTYGDILRDLNIKEMIKFHKKAKAFATLNVYKRESEGVKSMVMIDSQNHVTNFIERPNLQQLREDEIWVNGSFYIFERGIFDFIPNKKSDFGIDIFPKLLKEKKILYAYSTSDYLVDIGDIKKLNLARSTFKRVR